MYSWTRGLLLLCLHKSLDAAECRSRRGDADIEQLSRLVSFVVKLCLKSSLEIRELQAYVVPKENELVQATVDATKAYADSVAEANKIAAERERQSKLELVGTAHGHRWASVVRMAGASNSAISTPERVTEIIYVSKSKKAYDKRQTKMHIAAAESANHILALVGEVLMLIGTKSFYLKCLMSELATKCRKKYDVDACSGSLYRTVSSLEFLVVL